jgi:hypothetical protein
MSTRLVVIAAAAAVGQQQGAVPSSDDPAMPVDPAMLARIRAALGPATGAWCAPEQSARDTAGSLDLEPDEVGALAAWWGEDGGEPLEGLLARTGGWLEDVDAGTRRGVVVASPPVVRALVVNALDAPAAVFWRLDVAVLSVSVLTRADDRWRVRSIGDR